MKLTNEVNSLFEGATNIGFFLPKKATKTEIEAEFKKRRKADAEMNGDSDSYSGDLQTVKRVEYRYLSDSNVFENRSKAEDFCLDKAEKWEFVVAVYFKQDGKVFTLVAGWGAE
jgi:hypothetical protein